jgi:hypothetical protein
MLLYLAGLRCKLAALFCTPGAPRVFNIAMGALLAGAVVLFIQ